MEDVAFSSIEELYKRLKPALMTKSDELKRNGIDYITSEDIWNYLKEYVWINSRNLRLFRMVDDILNADNEKIEDYVKNKMASKERNVYFNDNMEENLDEKSN